MLKFTVGPFRHYLLNESLYFRPFFPSSKSQRQANATGTKNCKATESSDLKRVCYYSNWAKYRPAPSTFSPEIINASLCTHIIYAYAELKDNDIHMYEDDQGTLQMLRDMRNINPDLKILLSVGGYAQGTEEFIKTVSSEENIAEFAFNAMLHLNMHHFDGLDLDWEFPGDQGISHKDHFTALVKSLMKAFEVESDAYNVERLLLSASVSAYAPVVDRSYDVAEISKYLDMINLMAYDMQQNTHNVARFNSPLYGLPSDTGNDVYRNQHYAIQHWLNKGAPGSKLVVGLATFGRTFTLADQYMYRVGDPVTGPGLPGQYTQKYGFLAFYEICMYGWNWMMNTEQSVPFAWDGNQWVGYDDVESMTIKANYIVNSGLAGAMFWLDYDDYDNVCGQGFFPLINSVKSVFKSRSETLSTSSTSTTQRPTTTTQRPTTTTHRPTTTTHRPTTTTQRPTTTTQRSTTTTQAPTTQQPGSNGCTAPTQCVGFFMADPCNSRRYYQCGAGNQKFHMFCNTNLVWNQAVRNCVRPPARRTFAQGSKTKEDKRKTGGPYTKKQTKNKEIANTILQADETYNENERQEKRINELRELMKLVKTVAEMKPRNEEN
ncbi:chitinase-3-like protein 1 [Ylistrum balloti]|uniref:chitinase-3-like protein 1 n=1 Tax=Ylistrum balloti TaxID=509963 RepID=UPI002905B1B0|nr:chitinase-3-like protein 1 [Ylistrum balloti]